MTYKLLRHNDFIEEIPFQRKKKPQETQRAWVKYRDLNCNFYADPNFGTSALLNIHSCLLDATASRAKEFEWI